MTPPFAQARIESLLEHSTWIRGLAAQLASDPGTADDLVQKTWVAALERPPGSDRDARSLRRWLAAVLRNFARQESRGSVRRADHEARAAAAPVQPSTFDVVARASVQREVVQAVLALEEPYRTTILLRFYDGLAPRAIAREMRVPVDTVRTRVARGIARLRAILDEGRGGDRAAWLAALVPFLRPPAPALPLSGTPAALGATLVNAKIQIAAAALVLGGALTLYLASRPKSGDPAPAPAVVAAADAAAEKPAEPSSSPLASEAATTPPAGTRAPAPLAPTQAVVAEVAAEPAILRGRVLDDRGAPASGVQIGVDRGNGSKPEESATSLANGAFEMPFPKEGGQLVSADERYVTVLAGMCGRAPSEGEVVVVIAPRVALSGRVVGEEGNPLPGARLGIEVPAELRTRFRTVLDRSVEVDWTAVADERGAFAIDGAPRTEGAILRAASDGYVGFSGPLAEHTGPGLVITLARPRSADGLLRGKVVDGAGSPVGGARVAFGIDMARSESDGSFTFKLVDPESFGAQFNVPARELSAVKKGYLPARYEPPLVEGLPSWPANVVLRLGETPFAIEGRVVDDEGDPFPGASVWIADATLLGAEPRGPIHVENVLAGAEDSIWRHIETDGEGRFRLDGLLQREYKLRAMDPETLLIAEAGPFAAGATDAEIRMPTDQLYPKVAGRVLSHAGKPVAGARVFPMCDAFQARMKGQIVSTSHQALEGTTTDADGKFVLPNVPKTLVYVRVEGEGILPLEYGRYVEGDERFKDAIVRELPKDRIEKLEIVVDLRCHVQVELADPTAADELEVLDGQGRPLVINIILGNSRREGERVEIVDGRSYPMAVPDSARTIVLYKGGVEVARKSVAIVPGELMQVKM
jgi:RNA polymerase sigma-70 factor (ECF subfamily)